MIHYTCDLCGKAMAGDGETRYVVRIEVYAAPGMPEMTREELEKDHKKEILALLAQMEKMSTQEIQNGVYRLMRFDLCPACQKLYVSNPLGKGLVRRFGAHTQN